MASILLFSISFIQSHPIYKSNTCHHLCPWLTEEGLMVRTDWSTPLVQPTSRSQDGTTMTFLEISRVLTPLPAALSPFASRIPHRPTICRPWAPWLDHNKFHDCAPLALIK
ncbi:MAG: hypothetical protein BYD32DRAFT_388525 [Podila humilis]|nr:MAG: hypothetical protein BYD32DRAFT_388525 [Podila humilis]